MRILVAGATGVIGRSLLPALAAAGHEVWGTARSDSGIAAVSSAGAHPVQLDVFDAPAVHAAVRDAAPDVIVHQLTALSGMDFDANARIRTVATRTLVDAAQAQGVTRMIAQSISFVYPPGRTLATEQDPIDPDPARATTLDGVRALESAVAELDQGIVLRYGTLYGHGTWYHYDGPVAEQARAGSLEAGPEVSCFLHVSDAVSATLAALNWPAGVVNIVDDEPAAARDWVPVFAASVDAPPPIAVTATEPIGRPVSNALARSRGWAPGITSWRTGFVASGRSDR